MKYFEKFKGTLIMDRLICNLLVTISYYPIAPLLNKLQGIHFSVFTITLISLIMVLPGMVQIVIKKMKMFNLLRLLMISDVTVIILLIAYLYTNIDVSLFLYLLYGVFFVQCVLGEAMSNTMSDFIAKKYPDLNKDYLACKSFVLSVGRVSILSLALLMNLLFNEISNVILGAVLIVFSLYFQYRLYVNLKESFLKDKNKVKDMENEDTFRARES